MPDLQCKGARLRDYSHVEDGLQRGRTPRNAVGRRAPRTGVSVVEGRLEAAVPEADIRRTFCPEVFGDKYRCDWCHDDNDNCDECLERPMPAEVAEKLGIKPIDHQSDDVHNGCVGCKYAKRSVVEAPCAQCGGWKMITPDTNRRGDLWEAEK